MAETTTFAVAQGTLWLHRGSAPTAILGAGDVRPGAAIGPIVKITDSGGYR
jgi:hypothetical protein